MLIRLTPVELASRSSVVVVVTLLLGCSNGGSSVEILAEAPANPGTDLRPDAAVAASDAELDDAWTLFGFEGDPQISLDDGPVLFIGTVESGSCPATVDYVGPRPEDVEVDDEAFVRLGTSGGPDCTTDANPVSFVVRADGIANAESVFVQNGDAASPLSASIPLG